MAPSLSGPRTIGAADFNPDILLLKWSQNERTLPTDNDLRSAITKTFSLPSPDTYVYHAIASVTLSQMQDAINHGDEGGLHAWYREEGNNTSPAKQSPPSTDITAYTTIFSPTTSTAKALTAFASNATKLSLRKSIAAHLLAHRLLPPTLSSIPRCKSHSNPYFDFWAWSCHCLEWCGPDPASAAGARSSHHVLPVFMHHFGCVVPSYEALEVVRLVAGGREVVDVGSGNGYWTYMLRRQGVRVTAVDNAQSSWRTMWIGDTVVRDGERFLREEEEGAGGKVLLMVYPVVGGEFTRKMIEAYKGGTVVVVGTQGRSGYTAFKDRTIEEWMVEEREGWVKTVQMPLPSFAGMDEAMFVFELQGK